MSPDDDKLAATTFTCVVAVHTNRSQVDVPDFQVTIVDKRGVERLALWDEENMEPVPVGSVLVVREGSVALGAYLVGEEDYQVRGL